MMRQARLDRYFDIPQPLIGLGPTLLQLPASIRARVYTHLDFDRGNYIHLNSPVPSNPQDLFGKAALLAPSAHTLLLVCKTLYQEVCPILYAQNHFTVSRNAPGGLSPVFNLGPLALASTVSLTIVLHECRSLCQAANGDGTCLYNCEICVELGLPKKRRPLANRSRQDRAIIKEWEQLCGRMARLLKPSRLRLCFICDTNDRHTAQEIVKPMHQLPNLAAFSIRLSVNPVPELRYLARGTALYLTGRSSVKSTMASLPNELQAKILEHTDLVAPHDLEWIPNFGYECWPPDNDPTSRRYQSSLSVRNPCELCLRIQKNRSYKMRRLDATHSQCTCWRFPSELFFVSHEVHRIATRIFYSRNHFNIRGDDGDARCWQPALDFPPLNKHLPQQAASQLRSLRFVILDILSFSPEIFDKSMQDWVECLDILRRDADLARLAVTVDMSCSLNNMDMYCTQEEGAESDGTAWVKEQRIMKPLTLLRGLKSLFIHLGYPKYSMDRVEERVKRESLLERSIMGEGYNADERGKLANSDRWRHSA